MISIDNDLGLKVELKRVGHLDAETGKNIYNYHVLINGVHCATWVRSWYKTDYDLHTPDGEMIKSSPSMVCAESSSDFFGVKVRTRRFVNDGLISEHPPKPALKKKRPLRK